MEVQNARWGILYYLGGAVAQWLCTAHPMRGLEVRFLSALFQIPSTNTILILRLDLEAWYASNKPVGCILQKKLLRTHFGCLFSMQLVFFDDDASLGAIMHRGNKYL